MHDLFHLNLTTPFYRAAGMGPEDFSRHRRDLTCPVPLSETTTARHRRATSDRSSPTERMAGAAACIESAVARDDPAGLGLSCRFHGPLRASTKEFVLIDKHANELGGAAGHGLPDGSGTAEQEFR